MLKSGSYTEKELMDEISIFHHYRAEKNGPLLDSRGLYNRRIDEAELFLYGDYTRRTDREIEG